MDFSALKVVKCQLCGIDIVTREVCDKEDNSIAERREKVSECMLAILVDKKKTKKDSITF